MTKYALYKYSTDNIGDDIQSLAARRFLPRVDYYIDRDQVGLFQAKDNTDEIKLIANGWYLHSPYAWPPTDSNLHPLLISMYFNMNNKDVANAVQSSQSIAFLHRYGNQGGGVGARDLGTKNMLQDLGIPAYFSGCLTLTLQRDNQLARQDYVLCVDVSDEVYQMICKNTNRPVIKMTPQITPTLDRSERFTLAELFLTAYQAAHAVVTSRLHCVLPCMALQTPVLHVKSKGIQNYPRFAGLERLVRSIEENEYLGHYDLFQVDSPPGNSKDYLTLREQLINTAQKYTGFDSEKSFRIKTDGLELNADILATIMRFIEPSWTQYTNQKHLIRARTQAQNNYVELQRAQQQAQHNYQALQRVQAEAVQNYQAFVQAQAEAVRNYEELQKVLIELAAYRNLVQGGASGD